MITSFCLPVSSRAGKEREMEMVSASDLVVDYRCRNFHVNVWYSYQVKIHRNHFEQAYVLEVEPITGNLNVRVAVFKCTDLCSPV